MTTALAQKIGDFLDRYRLPDHATVELGDIVIEAQAEAVERCQKALIERVAKTLEEQAA